MSFINERKVPSPFESFPGYVVLPVELTPEQFDVWWRAANENQEQDDQRLSDWFQAWRMRHHFVLEWHLEGLDPAKHVTSDGMKMPSMKLIAWIDRITRGLIEDALDLPKSQAPSKGAENGIEPEPMETVPMTA